MLHCEPEVGWVSWRSIWSLAQFMLWPCRESNLDAAVSQRDKPSVSFHAEFIIEEVYGAWMQMRPLLTRFLLACLAVLLSRSGLVSSTPCKINWHKQIETKILNNQQIHFIHQTAQWHHHSPNRQTWQDLEANGYLSLLC